MGLISLKSDYAFKALFSHENVRRQFLSDVLGIPLEEIRCTVLINPNLSANYEKQKQGILDVLMELEDGTRVNVELQVRRIAHWTNRQLFYLARMYTQDLKSGDQYDKLHRCVSIAVLDFNLTDSPQYHNRYCMRNERGEDMSDMLEAHVIELRKKLSGESAVDDWIRLFNAENEEELKMIRTRSAGMREAIAAVREMGLSKALRYRHEMILKMKRDQWAMEEYERYERECARNEGKAEGRAEAIILLLHHMKTDAKDDASESFWESDSSMEELRQKIMAEKDLDVLSGWFEAAVRAESVKDFRRNCGI